MNNIYIKYYVINHLKIHYEIIVIIIITIFFWLYNILCNL